MSAREIQEIRCFTVSQFYCLVWPGNQATSKRDEKAATRHNGRYRERA